MKKRTVVKIFSFNLAIILSLMTFLLIKEKQNKEIKVQINNRLVENDENIEDTFKNISKNLTKIQYASSPLNKYVIKASVFTQNGIDFAKKENNAELKKYFSELYNLLINFDGSEISKKKIEIFKDKTNEIIKIYNKNKNLKNLVSEDFFVTLTENEANLGEYIECRSALSEREYYQKVLLEKNSIYLSNLNKISENAAKNIAKEIVKDNDFSLNNKKYGTNDCYFIVGTNYQLYLTQKGGYPIYYKNKRNIQKSELTEDAALRKANVFLKKIDFSEMEFSNKIKNENTIDFEYFFKDGNTLCYTDKITISVALDNGDIIGVDALPFLTNHSTRVFETPKFTLLDAINSLEKNISAEEEKTVLIPTVNGGEIRCFEIFCDDGEEKFKIFINCKNLVCEEIMINDEVY